MFLGLSRNWPQVTNQKLYSKNEVTNRIPHLPYITTYGLILTAY